jgi:hypothetical protein
MKILNLYENSLDRSWYDSSNILYSECDDNENALKTLRIVFKNGRQYRYDEVNVNDYLLFREDVSQGKAFNKFIRKYKSERIEDADEHALNEERERILERQQENSDTEQNQSSGTTMATVISAFPCCGKTYAFNALKGKMEVADLDYTLYTETNEEDKFTHFMDDLTHGMKEKRIIFVSAHQKIRTELENRGIPFIFYLPSSQRKSEIIELMKMRGNCEDMVESLERFYDDTVSYMLNNPHTKNVVVLQNEGDFILNDSLFKSILNNEKQD